MTLIILDTEYLRCVLVSSLIVIFFTIN